ncbi:ParA family protein [Nibribacter koreensis]|uniref:AAA family ATPase n=1 Tax=Nibribacter koreensis TaxID=1084519 RepID=A0ABP8G356_9BACT
MEFYIISVLSNKGGVSKTTSAINIAAYLANKGKRVLLIDFDAQANSTLSTIGTGNGHVGEWLVGEKSFSDVVVPYIDNLDVLPAARALDTYAKAIGSENDYQFLLKERIEEEKLDDSYNYIIIDNAPSLTTLAYTTFIAATHILLPSAPEEFAIAGIANVLQTVANVKKRYNPTLKVAGIFFSKYHPSYRSKIDNDMVFATKDAYGDLVMETTIRTNVSIKEALAFKKPVFEYAPDSQGSKDYEALVKELIERL